MIDLRSDTVTQPTQAMREAMASAQVGDDVYGEDPTVLQLEETAADLLGKEAALFVTSGTQGNQVAIASHVKTGEEVIAEAESHVFMYEAAAVSVFTGAQIRQVAGHRGSMSAAAVEAAIRDDTDIHQPRTALITVEDTHNRAGGAVLPIRDLQDLRKVADSYGIPVHMDGARLFNAAVALDMPPREIAAYADTVQICLSKGLCAPIGSLVLGSREFIESCRKWRKRLGGGLRQAGVIAAPGLIALEEMRSRLKDDHDNAKKLANGLAEIEGIAVNPDKVDTNIVIVELEQSVDTTAFVSALKRHGVLANGFGAKRVRFVTHHDVSTVDIAAAKQVVQRVMTEER
ncbi:low-specificity L-threonine aldolase [Alicyclobacillus sp. SO9]|nr:low-specificity L-threonine aldolase [Alicyclobacillus sp. SO9]QQE81344.1 low-specificity L-threonine aldolase [Alicyclobacillus sp. SO9]